MAPSSPRPLRALVLEAAALKDLDRAGWKRAGVPRAESVAAHSWGVAWLALVFHRPPLDREKVLAMAIIHDLPEVRAGDLTPHDPVDALEKRRREASAARALLPPPLLGLWEEYERQDTPEARFVRQLDRLDMGLQAMRYRAEGRIAPAAAAEFVESALAVVTLPELRALLGAEADSPEPRHGG